MFPDNRPIMPMLMLVRVLFGSKSGYGLGGLPVNLRTHLDRNSKLIGQIDVGTVSVT